MSANTKIFAGPGPIRIPILSSDPGSPVNGDMWYNSTATAFKVYENGAVVTKVSSASNVGAGSQVFKAKTGADLAFRSIVAGANVTVTQNTNDITIAASASSSPLTTKGDVYTHDATVDARLAVGTNGQVLSADSAEATGLKWITNPGAGANTALSNLVAPIAINEDLVFDTGGAAEIKTKDAISVTNSEDMRHASGTAVDGNSGSALVKSGDVSGTGASGAIVLQSGSANDGGTGGLTAASGDVTGGTSDSGDLLIASGAVGGGGTGNSGDILINSGTSANDSGAVTIASGNTTSSSGAATLKTGAASDVGATSGGVTISTGNASNSGGSSGGVTIVTGTAGSGGTWGQIVLAGKGEQDDLADVSQGTTQIAGGIRHTNAENGIYYARPAEKTLANTTASPTNITDWNWPDSTYSVAVIDYVMFEKSTGLVSRGRITVVQDANTIANIAFTDERFVENTGFPAVVLSAVEGSGVVGIQFTNASANDVLFQGRFEGWPFNVGSL